MSTATPPVVRADHVSKSFGATRALRDVRLEVRAGEIHALVGRNGAGKSTLVSILTGLQAPDTGTLEYAGRPAPALSDREAWRRSVACVYQKLTVIDDLSVAENLFLNRQSERGRPIRWKELRARAADLLAEWDLDIDPAGRAGDLSVEHRQLVEIARALSYGARFVILDEPTARLDAAAIARLFAKIRALRDAGITFLYISHHLQEIFDLCDHVTVFRDAQLIRSDPIGEINHRELVEAMTGEAFAERADPRTPSPVDTPVVLSLDALSGATYDDISLQVRAGEVVGLAGAGGSGKFDIAEAVVGLQRPASGTISISGTVLRPGDVRRAQAAGVGFVPKD
ncbi:MAG: sugar ABC transporter ATP-binding protein, partial [Nocardioides sp.]|nr:sugar ABC transporter ATP-binding protein [Nocardioides sp.]